jgi:hypothetical protein
MSGKSDSAQVVISSLTRGEDLVYTKGKPPFAVCMECRLCNCAARTYLPLKLPPRFDFVLNVRAARAIHLAVPHVLLVQVPEVLE